MDLQGLNNSRMKTFRACQRLHQYAFTLGYRPAREGGAKEFGSAAHAGMAAYLLARRDGHEDPTAAALAALPQLADVFAQVRLEELLRLWCAYWDGEAITVLAVETTFALPLLNPDTGYPSRTFQLKGTVDALVRLADGRVAILEHKTTSEDPSAGGAYRARLALDSQVSQYFEGAGALGYAADICIYDVLVKPRLLPLQATPPEARKYTKAGALYAAQRERDETVDEYRARVAAALAESPDKYLAQIEVPRLEDERAEYRFDVWQLAEQIRLSERTGRAPKNPDACFRYGGPCPFLDVCMRTASLDDPTRFVREPQPAAPEQAA